MAYRLIWTNRALNQIDEIWSYIAADSPVNASWMVQKLFAASDSLKQFPNSGRIVPEDQRGLRRELIVRPDRMIHEINSAINSVRVTRIIHGARDLTAIIRDDSE